MSSKLIGTDLFSFQKLDEKERKSMNATFLEEWEPKQVLVRMTHLKIHRLTEESKLVEQLPPEAFSFLMGSISALPLTFVKR